jgi:arylformamidase
MTGPHVFLDYDQDALDRAYNQSAYAPNIAQLTKRRASLSAETRRHLGAPQRLSYGLTEVEGLDLFAAKQTKAPIVLFVHGGAWRARGTENSAFQAEPFVAAGAHYIAIDFNSVDELKGNLLPMADQVRRAVAWVYRNAASFGGDSSRIYLTGHSSGGHLGACVMTTDWPRDFDLPPDVVKAAVLCSGMYDLYPVSLSARSNYVAFAEQMIEALSPQRHIDCLNAPLVIAHGTLETPEFQRQAREFVAAVQQAGKPVELLVGEGYNHFEIMETFANPYGLLGRAALRLFGLS